MFPKFPKFAKDPRLSSPPMLKVKLNMLEKINKNIKFIYLILKNKIVIVIIIKTY